MTNTTSKHDVNRKRIHLSDSSDSDAPLATKKVKVRTKYQSGSQAKDNAQSISPPLKRPQKKKTVLLKERPEGQIGVKIHQSSPAMPIWMRIENERGRWLKAMLE